MSVLPDCERPCGDVSGGFEGSERWAKIAPTPSECAAVLKEPRPLQVIDQRRGNYFHFATGAWKCNSHYAKGTSVVKRLGSRLTSQRVRVSSLVLPYTHWQTRQRPSPAHPTEKTSRRFSGVQQRVREPSPSDPHHMAAVSLSCTSWKWAVAAAAVEEGVKQRHTFQVWAESSWKEFTKLARGQSSWLCWYDSQKKKRTTHSCAK